MPLSIGVKRGVVRYQDGRVVRGHITHQPTQQPIMCYVEVVIDSTPRKSPRGMQKQKVFKHWRYSTQQ